MSNFICPTCGMNNIDCGKADYKTEREIELEKKLEIAVEALNTIKQAIEFGFPKRGIKIDTTHTMLLRAVEEKAQEALAKIKEIK